MMSLEQCHKLLTYEKALRREIMFLGIEMPAFAVDVEPDVKHLGIVISSV